MVLMVWDKSFSVNVNEIDAQHQRLVEMLNQLHEMMRAGNAKGVIGPLLDDLIKYAATHFGTEEKYFDKFNFVYSASHKAEHKKFVDKILAFQADFKSGNALLSMEIMSFLKDWLVNHIKGIDKKYTSCFNEHGLF
jgi:hemerythrin